MADITNITEPWEGHEGHEVEAFLKDQISYLRNTLSNIVSNRYGFSEYRQGTIFFYDEEGGTVINTLTLSGTIYYVSFTVDENPVFSVLTGDTNKYLTIFPSTKSGSIGEAGVNFPENYTYVVAIDTGTGYVNRFNGNISSGSSATIDIRPYMAVGSNRIRISVTGVESGQTKTSILTGTLTSLSLKCNHTWYTPWQSGEDYVINNIYFSGSIIKTLHVKLGESEWTKTYRSDENYATVATTYTLSAANFPAAMESGVHTVELWMTGEGVSTEHISFNIMCVSDNTPLVCINSIASAAINFTQSTLFGFAVVNADSVEISSSVTAEDTFILPSQVIAVEDGVPYTYSTALEVDTEWDDSRLAIIATPFDGQTMGNEYSISMPLDNSLAFLATSGAKIYINEALRANAESDRESLRNTAKNAEVASFPMICSGFAWSTDGHATDPEGHKALVAAAGCSVQVPTLNPFSMIGEQGLTIEFMIRSSNIADYETPIMSFVTMNASDNLEGLIVYPTQITVLGAQERSEVLQSCGLCEDVITHVCLVLQKNYAGNNGRSLASLYINGIPNVSFAFGNTTSFGSGGLSFGQSKTDGYLYMLRVYDFPLEGQMVKSNFLNAVIDGVEFNRELIREKDNILDGDTVAYDLCKARGYNIMLIEPERDSDDIPAFNNQTTVQASVVFEYGSHPDWNVRIDHVPLDGQGTTSKKYYRWNLRGKFADSCVWTYADGTTVTGKKGYMDGGSDGQAHLKIERFTAKKNIASSPQGHKMGACAMYDEVFAQMGIKSHMPNANWRIAVWQYPFMGFRRFSNGTYQFIGLYTAGPDKGCKSSFGYDKSSYPACMCIEGPNHDPRGTRFLHPWVDVAFDPNEETLTFGGEEAWDCDFCKYETSTKGTQEDWDNILDLYETEWKPAYDLVYHTSQHIESLADTGYASFTAINNDITNFLGQKTNGVSNMLLSFYDSEYNIWYYRNKTGLFEKLVRQDGDIADYQWNILTYLDTYLTTSTPTTAQIKAARRAKFRAEWSNFFDVDSTLAHRNFCVLIGAKDNDAKNSYPFKHLSLAQGGKWMWKQDDLDSIMKTDNNGQGTVKYSVEPGDTVMDVQIFQGSDSALWTMIWNEFQPELRTNMMAMATAMETIARQKGLAGQYLHESVYNLMAYYFFDNSAKYFPITAYQQDRVFGYIVPWLLDPTQAYNGVYPLTQALGDRYQEEKLWLERRIVYVFSKYRIGAFTGQNAGWGEMSFTLAANAPFTFNITPAIDLYPVANSGGASTGDVQGERTTAGQSTQITLQSSGATTNYIKGVDWLTSLGDLSGLRLTSRGGSSEINFAVVSKRMQSLKVGDADPNNILFNATSLTVSGASFEVIDARNVTTIANSVDLGGCQRLRKALFSGCASTGIMLPVGARVNEVSLPERTSYLFLHTLNQLTAENMHISASAMRNIISLYFYKSALLNPLVILTDILADPNNSLLYVNITWDGTLEATATQWNALVQIASSTNGVPNYKNVTFGSELVYDNDHQASVSGNLTVDHVYQDDYDMVRAAFPNLQITVGDFYLKFEDDRVLEICAYRWGDTYDIQEVDGVGGLLGSGTLEGNDDTLAYSDYMFAATYAIGAHGDVPATSDRTVQYRVELIVEGGRALDGENAPWDIAAASATKNVVFYPVQYGTTMTATALGSITADNWNSRTTVDPETGDTIDSWWKTQTILTDGGAVRNGRKYIATITANNACQYLRLGIRAVAGTNISWRVVSVGVTKLPKGITQAQCAAVSSLGTVFRKNSIISAFNELSKFNMVTTIDKQAFQNCTNLGGCIDVPYVTSNITVDMFTATSIQYVYIPLVRILGYTSSPAMYNAFFNCRNLVGIMVKSCTKVGGYIFYSSSLKYLIINQDNIPELISNTLYAKKVYVPDNLIEEYASADGWSSISSKIFPISQFGIDYPEETFWEDKW